MEPIRPARPSGLSRMLSRTSSRSTSRSRPSRPSGAQLHRIYSSYYLDDYNTYHEDDATTEDDVHHLPEEEEEEEEEQEEGAEVVEGTPASSLSRESSDLKEKEEEEESTKEEKEEPDTIPEIAGGLPNKRDLEAGQPPMGQPPLKKRQSTRSVKDPNLVTWDGRDDPANPKNWTKKQKWAATLVVSSFTFISPVSSSMVAPALTTIAADFHITEEAQQQLVLSIFVLAYAIGPLFLGPLSELYGRVRVLQIANAFYFIWNLACGFAQSKGQMMAFRFLAGLGGSAPLAIGGGLLSDCWRAEERGRAISIYSLAPLL